MTDRPADEEKKIIIDEDWKAQVEAEKEEAHRQTEGEDQAEPSGSEPQPEMPSGPLPPPTLDFVVSSFAMQAMVSLGMMANPLTQKSEVQLDQAKHFIDTIAMLQEKTEGNRTPEESAMFDNILHELRMSFVAVGQQGGPAAS